MASVTLKNVSKSYGATPVLRHIDLHIKDGEFVVLVGPSGCGKSTLLRMICGLEDISAGDLYISDERMNDLPPARRGIAMVFQSYALYPHMNVYKNMAFGLKVAHKGRGEVDRRVREAAKILQIDHLLERMPRQLSGGQRQRVAIGRAIVREPRVFLFDEPLSNLDAALRVQTRLEFAKMHRQFRATVVYVTHDQIEAMTLGDKIVVLHEGRIQQAGSPLELYQQPQNLFVATFIGSPKMNLLPGTLSAIQPDHVRVQLNGRTEVRADVQAKGRRVGEPVTLGVRSEHLVEDGSLSETFSGEVSIVDHHGDANYVYLTLAGGQELVVRGDGNREVRIGDKLTVSTGSSAFYLFDDQGQALPRLRPGTMVTARKR